MNELESDPIVQAKKLLADDAQQRAQRALSELEEFLRQWRAKWGCDLITIQQVVAR